MSTEDRNTPPYENVRLALSNVEGALHQLEYALLCSKPVLESEWVRRLQKSIERRWETVLGDGAPTCAICGKFGGRLVPSYAGDVHPHCAHPLERSGRIVR